VESHAGQGSHDDVWNDEGNLADFGSIRGRHQGNGVLVVDGANAVLTVKKTTKDKNGSSTEP
jgi:hypothetical protein